LGTYNNRTGDAGIQLFEYPRNRTTSLGATSLIDFIELFEPSIGFSLWGPEIATGHLMSVGLILVDPPVAHPKSQGLLATIFPSSTI
jgi:hypothetical protein